MDNIERFSYGDYVQYNKPLKTYKVYTKYVVDSYLGGYIFRVIIPFYARTIKMLHELRSEDAKLFEIFFITHEGEFIDIPEEAYPKMGDTIKIHDIERIVVLNPKTSDKVKEKIKKIHEKNLSPSERDRVLNEMLELNKDGETRCSVELDGLCFKSNDVIPNIAYWYTYITNEDIKREGEIALENIIVLKDMLSKEIEEKVDEIFGDIISELSVSETYSLKDMSEGGILKRCDTLASFAEDSIEIFKDFISQNKCVEVDNLSDASTYHNICSRLKIKITKYITDNSKWLKKQSIGALKRIISIF